MILTLQYFAQYVIVKLRVRLCACNLLRGAGTWLKAVTLSALSGWVRTVATWLLV